MGILRLAPPTVKRWLIFYSVGALGIVVQMSALLALTAGAGLCYLPATAIAVEIAVLHNFFWHERWTWADRAESGRHAFLRRLVWFHITNGALSIAGNVVLMRIFVGSLGIDCICANGLAIALCSILNFFAGDRIVFRSSGKPSKMRGAPMIRTPGRIVLSTFLLAAFTLPSQTTVAMSAELRPTALKAWHDYVEATERRIAAELSSNRGFLALDFQDAPQAARERRDAFAGEIPVRQIRATDENGRRIDIPDGMVHHWRGTVFIPNVTLDALMVRVANPRAEDTKQEDVLASQVLDRGPGQLKMYLKLQRSKIVTVVYNTEHLVQYQRLGTAKASSRSVATKIAEIENPRESNEREKPEGHDHGFLWRMNSYWRYEQVNGGVFVECESMTLSRSIPPILEYVIRPIINRVARESMQRTLGSMRLRLTASVKNGDTVACHSFLSKAARVVVGSISKKATRLPIATAINSVAITA